MNPPQGSAFGRLLVWGWLLIMVAISAVSALANEQAPDITSTPAPATVTVSHPTSTPLPPTATPSATPATARRLPLLQYDSAAFQTGDTAAMTPARFEAQMQWLADNGFTTLSDAELAAFLDGTYLPPARSVVLTFDARGQEFDRYAGVIIPALRRHHFHAIFFVLASQIHDDCQQYFTCWQTLAGWQAEGLISVGSYGFYPRDYASLTTGEMEGDAGYSKKYLEAKLGAPVIGFSFPNASAPEAAAPVLKALGYQFAVAGPVLPGRSIVSGDAGRYHLPRYCPYSSPDRLAFDQMLLSAVAPLPAAATASLP
jgi:peptidoglycan/xylan/chitin deacetylase (PgdA/CDA1 family)